MAVFCYLRWACKTEHSAHDILPLMPVYETQTHQTNVSNSYYLKNPVESLYYKGSKPYRLRISILFTIGWFWISVSIS